MNILTTNAFCVLFAFSCITSSAQTNTHLKDPDYNKPHLFDDMPSKMKLHITSLEALLDLPVGARVNTFIGSDFHFVGKVVSKSPSSNTQSKTVVVQSMNRVGASLTFTKLTQPDGSAKFIGRILSFKNGDAFEIVKEKDQYFLLKKNLYEIIGE